MEKRELRLKQLELKESEFQRHLAAQLQVENYLFDSPEKKSYRIIANLIITHQKISR